MVRFCISYVSDCIKDAMELRVIIPQKKHVRDQQSPEIELSSFQKEYPLLLLLHDEASSPEELLSMTRVERFAEERGVMVVVPQGLLSWYTDYAQRDSCINAANSEGAGHIENNFTEMCYESFLLEALAFLRRTFTVISDKREKTFVGGIGMGGFGALKLAFKYPERFSAAFTLDGEVDLQMKMDRQPWRKEQFEAIFGGCKAEGENDLPGCCTAFAGKGDAPRLLQIWAEDNFRGEMNRSLARTLQDGYPGYTGKALEGSWDWDKTDEMLKQAFAWL